MNKTKNLLLFLTAILLVTLNSCVSNAQYPHEGAYRGVPSNIIVPQWAPPYENSASVHYYYFPDMEIYYDVWEGEFVYLENGTWRFSSMLPPYLGNVNLYDAYVVMLSGRIHEPWRFHEQYLAHYPRYYYHTMGIEREHLRGYNENLRRNIYAPRHMDADRRFDPIRTMPNNREPQRVQYGSPNVGRPVPVQPNMRNPNFPNNNGSRDGQQNRNQNRGDDNRGDRGGDRH